MGVETPLHSKKTKIQGKMEDPQQTWDPVGAVGEGRGEGLVFFAWHKSGEVLNRRPNVRWVLCLAL